MLIDCYECLFEMLGGVFKCGLYDNFKMIVVQCNVYGKGKYQYNVVFLVFVWYCGFFFQLCKFYCVQIKGKVEWFICYMWESFLWLFESKLKVEGWIFDVDMVNVEVG